MKEPVIMAVLASAIGLGAAQAALATGAESGEVAQQPSPMPTAGSNRVLEERAGSWKATCDEMEGAGIFCRIFHIEQFGEWKTRNFIQAGPAWTPDTVGLVVATYLGFKEGTTVSIGIDRHGRHVLTAPKGNNLMISPAITEKIIEEMATGHKIVIDFHSYSGVRHLSLADLGPFKDLLAKVKTQLAKNSPTDAARK